MRKKVVYTLGYANVCVLFLLLNFFALTANAVDSKQNKGSALRGKIVYGNMDDIYVYEIQSNKNKKIYSKYQVGEVASNPCWLGKNDIIFNMSGIEPLKNHIAIMNSKGTNVKKLFEQKSSCRNPSVSTDGNKIAFLCVERTEQEPSSHFKLFITDSRGKLLKKINMKLDYYKPSWSSNGVNIAIADEQGTIYTVNYLTGTANKITKGITPAFSHDGKFMAFVRHRQFSGRSDLMVINLSTKEEKILVANDDFGQGPHSSPQWTSDGRHLLYAHYGRSTPPIEMQELMVYSFERNDSLKLFEAGIAISGFSLREN